MARSKREKVTCPLAAWPPPVRGKDGKIRFPGVSGKCHKHHSWCVRQFKAEQAGTRNGLTPNSRRASYRDAQALRQKRPAAEPSPLPAAPVVACPWPWKDTHPDKESAQKHLAWLKINGDEGYKAAEVYRCVTEPPHFHIGRARVPAERVRKERFRREEEAA